MLTNDGVSQPSAAKGIDLSAISERELLSDEERSRVLSAGRLKFTLISFVVTILIALSGMIFSGVSRIFDWLTPSIQQDLQQKTRRGAVELAETAQLGMVVGEAHMVELALADYVKDQDVVGLAVYDGQDHTVFRRGEGGAVLDTLFKLPPGVTHELHDRYAAWMPSEIEGTRVGRVAVIVSEARLHAGLHLRREILILAAAGCLFALLLSIVFVNLYIGPILRVTGRAFVRLERTTEAALTAARLKSQFLANMSHEIRTPMNGIIGVLDLLSRTQLTAKQQRYTQTIESSARGLLTIINDVLDFSKLEAGKYELRSDDFETGQMVQEVAELLSPKAHTKKLELVVRIDADVPPGVRGDSDRIKQVLMNLVGNAVKFTEQGAVELHVSREANSDLTRFAVIDSGMGIRVEDQAHLFGMFSQVDGSLTRKHGGTGLGLAISKHLVEAMGGSIGVDSALGKGSTFWFKIPLPLAENLQSATNPPAPREAAILLVVKNLTQRDAMRELIARWGMDCVWSESAEDASEQVVTRAGGFTVAVIDGAFEASDPASSTLFDLCAGEGLPVIRLLSTTQMVDERSGLGLQSVLCKPVRASELYNGLIAVMDGGLITPQRRPSETSMLDGPKSLRARVLVVDDNEINRVVAVELLSELGYDSETASNGLEAVARAQHSHFDAILMDCQMPELDGFGATKQIRQLPGDAGKVPIIALTAHAMADDRGRMLNGGMDDYATKPIRARVLDRLLRRWVGDGSASAKPGSPSDVLTTATIENLAPLRDPERRDSGGPISTTRPIAEAPDLDPTMPRSSRAIEIFLKSVPELIAGLTQAVEQKDTTQVKQLAHKLKGSCLSLGASRLAATCHAVEVAAIAGHIDRSAHARIPAQLSAVTPLLNQLRERHPSNDS